MPRKPKVKPFELIKAAEPGREYRWRVTSPESGDILATSSEWYKNKSECLQGAISTCNILNKFFNTLADKVSGEK